MVRWPWVSRLAYDAVERERNTLSGHLANLAHTYNELVREILTMRREGFVSTPALPEPQTPKALPPEIVDALDAIGLHGRARDQMETYAWRQLDRKKAAPEIASELLVGGLRSPQEEM